MDRHDQTKLSKAVSKALRHEPWLYELELDENGWTPAADLLAGLRKDFPDWASLEISDLQTMIDAAGKPRHEIQGSMIRALYGHSTPDTVVMVPGTPPAELFHGTSPESLPSIFSTGLLPMARQYVHLSKDREIAVLVGGRKSPHPEILVIDAAAANQAGVVFYRGSELIWVAHHIPPEFIGPVTRP